MLRNWQKLIQNGLAFALIIVMMVIPVSSVFAQETITVQVDGLLVYEQPNAASTLLAVMSLGSTIVKLADAQQNGFNKVQLPDGRQGWAVLTVAGVPGAASSTTATSSGGGATSNVIVRSLGNVRIRATPSLNGERIGGMGWGDEAFLLGFDNSGNWININFGGITGWAAEAWFELVSGNISGVGVTGGTTSGTSVPGGTVVQSLGNLRIRSAPSLTAEKIGLVPWGGLATLLGYDDSGDWININYNGIVGWSAAVWWQFSDSAVATTATTSSATTTTTASTAPASGEDYILYNAPRDNAVAILVVSAGTPFSVINPDAGNGFIMIRLPDGKDGFIKPKAGSTTTTTGTAPTTTTTTTTTTTSGASGVVVMSVGNIRLRAAPSLTSEQLASVPWGANMPAFAQSSDGLWLLVNYNGTEGWISAAWVQTVSGSTSSLPGR